MTLQRRTLLLATLPWPALAGAAPPTPSLPLRFPQDYGAHPAQAIEWWYLTGWPGNLDAADGRRFGYQLTFFRLPGPAPAGHGSALAARQLMLGHVALSDLRAGRQQHDQRLMRALPGVAERAAALGRVLRDELAHCAARPWPGERVLYLIWREPWMTVAPDTYISRTLDLFGWRTLPVAASERYPEVELDSYVGRVERVLLSSEPFHFKERHVEEVSELVGDTPVSLIDGEMTSWYGSRAIAGLEYLDEYTASCSL